MDLVCYIPSHNNSDDVGESLASIGGLPCVIVDNGSDANHLTRLQSLVAEHRGDVTLLRHETDVGRIANWEFCVRHFVHSGRTWLKWLFAGDRLVAESAQRLEAAAALYPQARLIAGTCILVEAARRELYQLLPSTRLLTPAESLREIAARGNWFGPPSAVCVHREAVAEGFRFGATPWSADLMFFLDVAARFPAAYLAEPIAEFHASRRRFYCRYAGSVTAMLQEGLARLDAIERLAALTGNAAETAPLQRDTEVAVASQILLAGARRAGLWRTLVTLARLAIPRILRRTVGRWRTPARTPAR